MTSLATGAAPAVDARDDRVFLGHPRGLAYLSFAEAWERFSYYGMQTLLVLYMVRQLLLPGHVENVYGIGALRGFIEGMYGPLSVQAFASAVFGLYTGFVYLTPIFGGLLADRVLGRKMTVTIGAILMAIGHFLMAFETSFLLALLCLLVGVGCFKGNIASQVGALYKPGDLRVTGAFQIYYIGINAAVIVSPLVCGSLGELVGWHWGFGAAGVGMLIGLVIYLAGSAYLPADPLLERRAGKAVSTKLRPGEGKMLALLFVLLPVLALGIVANQQIFNAYLLWTDQSADLVFFGRKVPTSWLITLDAITSTGFLVGSVAFWKLWSKRRKEPREITKMALGYAISITGVLALAAGAYVAQITDTKVNLAWLVAFHMLNSAGFANAFPAALALYSRLAPPALAATMIGIFYLHFFAANNLVGRLGGFLETMSATDFWLMHAAMVGFAAVIVLVVRRFFGHMLVGYDKVQT